VPTSEGQKKKTWVCRMPLRTRAELHAFCGVIVEFAADFPPSLIRPASERARCSDGAPRPHLPHHRVRLVCFTSPSPRFPHIQSLANST